MNIYIKGLMGAILAITTAITAAASAQSSRTHVRNPENGYQFGLNVEPHWLLIGGIGAKADLAVTRGTAIGIQGLYVPPKSMAHTTYDSNTNSFSRSYKWTYYEINVGPTFMLTGDLSTHGLYLSPAIGYMSNKISEYSSYNLSGSMNSPQLRTTVGYQWRIGGLRFAVGGGLRLVSQSEVVVKNSKGEPIYREKASSLGGLAIDGMVGWVF
jgi:hypothetical protein